MRSAWRPRFQSSPTDDVNPSTSTPDARTSRAVTADDALRPLQRVAALQAVADDRLEVEEIDASLDATQRAELYAAGTAAFARRWKLDAPPPAAPDLSAERFGDPLEVCVEALNSLLTEEDDRAELAAAGRSFAPPSTWSPPSAR